MRAITWRLSASGYPYRDGDLSQAKERAIANGDSPFVPYYCEHGFLVEMFKSCPQCEEGMRARGRAWEEEKRRILQDEEEDEEL